MHTADLEVGHAYARPAKPQGVDCPLLKIIFIGPAGRVRPRSVTPMVILTAWRVGAYTE
jgi:hypothetical protein